jgi:hypothetical protein
MSESEANLVTMNTDSLSREVSNKIILQTSVTKDRSTVKCFMVKKKKIIKDLLDVERSRACFFFTR